MLKIVDGGMAGVIFIVPWIMGGRDAIGQLILAILAVLTALAWFVRQAIRGGNVCRPMWPLVLAFRRSGLSVAANDSASQSFLGMHCAPAGRFAAALERSG